MRGRRIRSLLEIYALAVCFVSVIVLSIAAVSILSNVAQVIEPGFFMSGYIHERYQSDRAYRMYLSDRGFEMPTDEAETARLRKEDHAAALLNEVRQGYQEIFYSLIVIVVLSVVFLFHWKLSRRFSDQRDESPPG